MCTNGKDDDDDAYPELHDHAHDEDNGYDDVPDPDVVDVVDDHAVYR